MLGTWTPHKVYWTYIWSRAQRLGVHIGSAEQLALARLLCLSRASLQTEVEQIEHAWHSLGRSDQALLALLEGSGAPRALLAPLALAKVAGEDEAA